jgi:hypothetical protein
MAVGSARTRLANRYADPTVGPPELNQYAHVLHSVLHQRKLVMVG